MTTQSQIVSEAKASAQDAAVQAIRRADPDAQVLLGGLVYPDDDWLRSLIEQGRAPDYFDGTTLSQITLSPGEVAIFTVEP